MSQAKLCLKSKMIFHIYKNIGQGKCTDIIGAKVHDKAREAASVFANTEQVHPKYNLEKKW